MDGKFKLNVSASGKTLVVSCLGYTEQEVPAKASVSVVLKSDSEMLSEVVVTGMQQMDKRLFTGSTTKVQADQAKISGISSGYMFCPFEDKSMLLHLPLM